MRNYQIINDLLFTGGFVKDCDEKNIEDKDIVKDTNFKALHSLFEVDDDDDDHKNIIIDKSSCKQ